MQKALAIARREIAERSFVFVAAIVITLAPLLTLVVPRGTLDDRLSVFAVMSVILATAFVGGLSLILGGSLIGRELTEKRLSFYFSRPLSGASIWFGKLTAAIAMIVASAAIVFAPSVFFLPRWTTSWVALPIAFAILSGACLVLLLAAHTLSTMFRSRSPLLALDFAAVIVFMVCVFAAVAPLLMHHARLLSAAVAGFAVLAFVIGVVLGGAFQLERGRIDVRRNHRELSRFLWATLAIALLLIIGTTLWATSPKINDLSGPYAEQAPSGSWLFASGQAHRMDYTVAFLIDSKSGKSIEVPPQFAWFGAFNDSGTAAVWPQPASAVELLFAETFGLRHSDRHLTMELVTSRLSDAAQPNHTGIFLEGIPESIDVTPDLSRIAVLDNDTLAVYDTVAHKSLGSAHISAPTQRYDRLKVRFASPNEVLVFHSFTGKHLGRSVVDVRAFDVTKRELRTVFSEEIVASNVFAKASADGRSFLLRAFGEGAQPVRVFDLASGREISSISPEPGVRFISSWLLRDGRVAVTGIANSQGWLRVYRGGAVEREIALGSASQARIVAMPAHDQFIVSTSDKEHYARQSVVVDLNRGIVARAAGLSAIGSTYYAMGAEEGNNGSAVFIGPSGAYTTWNPATGEQKPLL